MRMLILDDQEPIVSMLLTATLGPFVVFLGLDLLLRPKAPAGTNPFFPLVTHLQWVLLPFTSAIFATLPAVDAQLQLLRGKPLTYILATPERPDDADNPVRCAYGAPAPVAIQDRFQQRALSAVHMRFVDH